MHCRAQFGDRTTAPHAGAREGPCRQVLLRQLDGRSSMLPRCCGPRGPQSRAAPLLPLLVPAVGASKGSMIASMKIRLSFGALRAFSRSAAVFTTNDRALVSGRNT